MKPFYFPEPVIISKNGGDPVKPFVIIDTIRESFDMDSDAVTLSVGTAVDGSVLVLPRTDGISRDILFSMKSKTAEELRKDFSENTAGSGGGRLIAGIREGLFPDLDVVLDEFPREKFVIDIPFKGRTEAAACAGMVNARGAHDRVMFTSRYSAPLDEVRNIIPDAPVTFSLMGAVGIYALFRSGILNFVRSFRTDVFLIPEMIGTSYFANPALIAQVQEKGVRVYVRDVTKPAQVSRLSDAGVNGYFTSDIAGMKKLLEGNEKG